MLQNILTNNVRVTFLYLKIGKGSTVLPFENFILKE